MFHSCATRSVWMHGPLAWAPACPHPPLTRWPAGSGRGSRACWAASRATGLDPSPPEQGEGPGATPCQTPNPPTPPPTPSHPQFFGPYYPLICSFVHERTEENACCAHCGVQSSFNVLLVPLHGSPLLPQQNAGDPGPLLYVGAGILSVRVVFVF